MKRPQLSDVSQHYLKIFNWVKIYVDSDDEAQSLTNNIHYLSVKEKRRALAIGLVVGWVSMLFFFSWLS